MAHETARVALAEDYIDERSLQAVQHAGELACIQEFQIPETDERLALDIVITAMVYYINEDLVFVGDLCGQVGDYLVQICLGG